MKIASRLMLITVTLYAAAFLSSPGLRSFGQEASPVPENNIERLDPRINAIIPAGAKLEKIADGFSWVEGPVWNKEGGFLLFSDIPNNAVFKWEEGKGVSLFLTPSGYTGKEPFHGKEPGSNGLAIDTGGRLVLAEHGDRRITRLDKYGTKTVIADRYDEKRLNSPNDLVFKSNGDLYFTDPPFGLPGTFEDPEKEHPFQGVYRVTPDGEITLLTNEIKAPNGIAFSPDEKILYVTDVSPERPAWLAYDVNYDGTISNGRVFHDAAEFVKTEKGAPDGMKTDKHGNLFGAGPGGVYIFSPDGTLLGRIKTGVPTSNVNWGNDGSVLYVTAGTAVYRIKLDTAGPGF
ncbi:MAG TPA: SMP-30/gluconolactonase/LRE family protein [Thermodesulfobacteriota bacterium]|nr:SMP-30/gluconolactonase/LRE family protein [Thermodesulfobacteriota bacterium]